MFDMTDYDIHVCNYFKLSGSTKKKQPYILSYFESLLYNVSIKRVSWKI